MKVMMSEVIKDIKSTKEFCNANKISPLMIIVVWAEEHDVK